MSPRGIMADSQAIVVSALLLAATVSPLLVGRVSPGSTDAAVGRETPNTMPDDAPAPAIDLLQTSKDEVAAGSVSVKAVRSDLAKYGTAIGVASSGLVAVGTWATFDKLLPIPKSTAGWWIFALAIVLAVAAIVCAGVLTSSFFRARRRILVDTQFWTNPGNASLQALVSADLSTTERDLIFGKLKEVVDEEFGKNSTKSLPDLEEVIARQRREATRLRLSGATVPNIQRVEYDATRLYTRLMAGLVSGAVLVIEHRSGNLYRGPLAPALAAITAVCVGGLFFISSWSEGVHERITSWTTCITEVPPAAQQQACTKLDPREGGATYPVISPRPAPTVTVPTPVPGPTVTVTPRPAASTVVRRLNSCARQRSVKSVPTSLRVRALARCAGL